MKVSLEYRGDCCIEVWCVVGNRVVLFLFLCFFKSDSFDFKSWF